MAEIIAEGILPASALQQYLGVFTVPMGGGTTLIKEAKVHWNDDGILTRAVEAANVCMVDVRLAADAFESYDSPGAATIGLNVNRIAESIKPAGSDQLVHLAVDMETHRLRVDFGNASQTIGMIDPESIRQEPEEPDLDLPNTATVEAADLKDAIAVADTVSDHLYLRGDPDAGEVTVYSQGDIDDAEVTFDWDMMLDGKLREATEAIYSMEFMKAVTKPIPNDAEVTVTFGDELPVRIDWAAFDGGLSVRTMTAPRIRSA